MKTGSASANRLCAAFAAIAFALVLAFGIAGQAQAAQGSDSLVAGSSFIQAQDDESDEDMDAESDGALDEDGLELNAGTLWIGYPEGYWVGDFASNFYDDCKVTKITSSNPAVVKVSKAEKGYDPYSYKMKPIKQGKSNVTIYYKTDGVSKTVSATFTVKKFPNPIKYIKLNGKKLTVPTAKKLFTSNTVYNFKGKSVKVQVKLAPGWKISNMEGSRNSDGAMEEDDTFKVKNGKSFKVSKKKSASVYFTITRTNAGGDVDTFSYYLNVSRGNPIDLRKSWAQYNSIHIGFPIASPWALFTNCDKEAKVYKVTSSSPGVLKAKCGKSAKKLKLIGKKAGTSTVTLYYKYKGKEYQTSLKYSVEKSPVASLVVNGKKVKLTSEYQYNLSNYKKGSVKLKLLPGDSWKVKSITWYDYSNNKSKKMKNGASLKTPKGTDGSWDVVLKNSSGKTCTFGVVVNRS